MLYIHNATILTPQEQLEAGAMLIEAERIRAVGPQQTLPCPPDAVRLDASGLLLAPGLIDLQLNGAFGRDFTTDPATIWSVAAQLPRYGVTAFLPTIITAPPACIRAAQRVLAGGPPAGWSGAVPLGLHLEGPMLNPTRKGAHNPAYLRLPTPELVATWSPDSRVRLVTLAPELPHALDIINILTRHGIVVSAGHSTASYAEAQAGFEIGVRYGTHLFNAMGPFQPREPGLAGALLVNPTTTAGLIVDGVHVHPAAVALAWQALGPTRLNLVTDAMAALGTTPGHYQLGDFGVTVDSTSARLADGTLAGSILSLDQAVRNLVAYTGCSLQDALTTVTATPARVLGLQHERGILVPGALADLVLLTESGHVMITIVRGQIVFDQKGSYAD